MKYVRTRTMCRHLLLGVGLCLLLSLAATVSHSADVVVVANKNVEASGLTAKDIGKIFLGKKSTWDGGSRIQLASLKEGEVHTGFLKTLVGKTASQFAIYWKKLVFSGKAKEPKSFSSETDLLKYVSQTDGAVGYVSASTAGDKAAMAGCKILFKD